MKLILLALTIVVVVTTIVSFLVARDKPEEPIIIPVSSLEDLENEVEKSTTAYKATVDKVEKVESKVKKIKSKTKIKEKNGDTSN